DLGGHRPHRRGPGLPRGRRRSPAYGMGRRRTVPEAGRRVRHDHSTLLVGWRGTLRRAPEGEAQRPDAHRLRLHRQPRREVHVSGVVIPPAMGPAAVPFPAGPNLLATLHAAAWSRRWRTGLGLLGGAAQGYLAGGGAGELRRAAQ